MICARVVLLIAALSTAGVSLADESNEQTIEAFSGPAWERLVAEGIAAQFFLVGEEHGIAENPVLIARLFSALTDHGYSRFVVEISPTMASELDDAIAKHGIDGLRALYAQPGGEPAFFGMAEEARMLAAVRAAAQADEPVLWGTDYEVLSDRHLIRLLQAAEKPAAAEAAVDDLAKASAASWARYEETRSPQFIFSFAGDPALVTAVREAWPKPDPRSATILNTLEKTLAVNKLWVEGRAWESNRARSQLQRENFLRYWRAEKQRGEAPKVLAKFGASHMVRGLSQTAVFDLGTLLPELAALEGGHSFSLLVLPGRGSSVAVMNPSTWQYEPSSAKDSYDSGLEPIVSAAFDDVFTLIDLVSLRKIIGMRRGNLDHELFRIIHGFDMLLVMSGSTPSGELEHE